MGQDIYHWHSEQTLGTQQHMYEEVSESSPTIQALAVIRKSRARKRRDTTVSVLNESSTRAFITMWPYLTFLLRRLNDRLAHKKQS